MFSKQRISILLFVTLTLADETYYEKEIVGLTSHEFLFSSLMLDI